jgi:hypothetical protein
VKRPRRRKRPTSRKSQTKKQRRKQAVVERSLSDINYKWWWRKHPSWSEVGALSLDEQKAAVFYEAFRRCQELKDAWLKGISGPKAMVDFGWQMFTATVLGNLPQTWIQLPLSLRKAITTQQLPDMLPPVGYSVWPSEPFFFDPQAIPPKDDFETQEEYDEHWRAETLEQYHERCRNLAAKIIVLPPMDDASDDSSSFLKDLHKREANGFVLVAIDNKSHEAFNYAVQFLQRRFKSRRSYRAADIFWRWPENTDRGCIVAEVKAIGKRVKKNKDGQTVILEDKVFNFRELCKELEGYDKTGTPSDLMKRLRSNYERL